MLQRNHRDVSESLLPEQIATALIADADCEAVIEHVETDTDSIVSVPNIEEANGVPNGDHSTVYRIGDGYIVAEGDQETYSEFVAMERSELPRYLDWCFGGEPKRITHDATADLWRREQL